MISTGPAVRDPDDTQRTVSFLLSDVAHRYQRRLPALTESDWAYWVFTGFFAAFHWKNRIFF